MNYSAIIIIAKEPRVGKTKTRLTPPLSPTEATIFYEALLRDTISLVSGIEGVDTAIAYSPPDSTDYFMQISPSGTILLPVECVDIGGCLSKALGDLLERGYLRVLALNADSPTLPQRILEEAIKQLDKNDIVFGPTLDGGYYLVGLKELYGKIFSDIKWSTSTVLSETLSKVYDLGLRVGILPSWYDIDTPADILHLKKDLLRLPNNALNHTRLVLQSVRV